MTQTRRISLGFLLLGLMALCSPASAGVVLFSDLSPADTTNYSGGIVWGFFDAQGVAELFPVSGAGNFSVTQIDFFLTAGSVFSPNYTISIWTDSSNAFGTQLASWTLPPPALSCCNLTSITGITGLNLVGGQSYFIAFTPVNANVSSMTIWDVNLVGTTTPTILNSSDLGATWANLGLCPCGMGAFDVLGVATPEPGTIGTLGAGLLVLGLLRKRLR
jgi:hypothetical protein